MSGLPWFRVYAEMIDNPKIGSLSDAEFRTFISILCCACKACSDGDTKLTADQLNWVLRCNVTETLQKLLDVTLIAVTKTGTIFVKNWSKRQFISDSSKNRVRKYRETKKKKNSNGRGNDNVTLQKRNGNAIDTDTDTDTDKEKEEICANAQNDFEIFWQAYPRRKDKARTFKLFNKINPDAELLQQMLDAIENQNTEKIYQQRHTGWSADWKHPATWLNGKNWNDEVNIDEDYWRNKTNKRDGKKPTESLVEKSRRERAERRGEITPSRFASGFTIEHGALTDERD